MSARMPMSGPDIGHIEVQLACAAEEEIPDPESMASWAAATLEAEHSGRRALCLRVVDEDEMCALNSRWRARDSSTNVLAFAGPPGTDDALPLGDVVICAEVVAREAPAPRRRAHWAHMVVHGTLHLLGHDHCEDADAERMESRESAILQTLGFACPYHGAQP